MNNPPLKQRLRDKELFGEPCPDYDPECFNCIHFKMVDTIEVAIKALEDTVNENTGGGVAPIKYALEALDAIELIWENKE